ncbi:PAS domain-containing protein, partial [Streptomyces sp. 8K308]|uniref:PAS domain-containing protein n=1 Tax=Streptomyces sp. 8K308 TaxID=2530388 RepID=UPI0010513600
MSSRPARGAARLAAILDALPDALLLVNGNGTVVNANAIAMETLGAPGAPLVGRGLLDIVPDFDPRRIPGSMRRPDDDPTARTKPTRMVARRTDGVELQVEVTSAGLNSAHSPYASAIEAAFADDYGGEELLVLIIRDLSGTLDTEAELVRQQRQTEMILRAASEGVIGVDTAGRIVLVNPAAAQILGHRASQLGGQELHPLVQHSRIDGTPLAFEETPLHDTLTSGRKHRVRGQVLWTKDGRPVPVDLTTAPVRDGDQLVGAVLAFSDRRKYDALAARHAQLVSVLGESLRGPLDQLRGELGSLAADSAGQLWPEANQVLHHLAAGYSRMTTLLDNVLSFQRLDEGREKLSIERVSLDEVVSAGVEGATELIGPGRAQFAVHAPPIEAEVDPERMAQALAHLVADVAGVDATGQTAAAMGGAPAGDSTIVVAAAQRGDVVRIEVRGPYGGGSPVHEPIVRGIVRLHGGVLQTHEVGGAAAYVLEVPVAAGGGTLAPGTGAGAARDGSGDTTVMPVPAQPARGTGGVARRPAAAIEPAHLQSEPQAAGQSPTGRRRRAAAPDERQSPVEHVPEQQSGTQGGNGRRRRALTAAPQAPAEETPAEPGPGGEAAAQPTGRRRRAAGQGGQGGQGGQEAVVQLPQQQGQPARQEPIALGPAPVPAQANAPAPAGPVGLEPAVGQPGVPGTPPVGPAQPPGGEQSGPPALPAGPEARQHGPQEEAVAEEPPPVEHSVVAASPILDGTAPRVPTVRQPRALPMPGSDRAKPDRSLPGVSVQTLGQGVPVASLPERRQVAGALPTAA